MFIGLFSVCIKGEFSESLVSSLKGTIKYASLNINPYQARPILADINSDGNVFYPFSISVNKCGGSCNNIGDPYTRACVPNKVKNMNVRVFNLMSEVNETNNLVKNKSHVSKCI